MNNTWVLLRGLGREAAHWGPFLEEFTAAVAPEPVIAIDLPGAGEHFVRVSPTSMDGIFRFVRAEAVRRAPSNSKFSLVSMSLGGMVATEWLKQKPEDLARVVLMNTSDRALSPVHTRLRWQVWPRFVRLLAQPAVRERERELLELLVNREAARAAALPLWIKLANDHPMSYRSFANQLWAAARFSGLSEKVDVPVLLLSSLGDRFVDPSCSTALHRKWGWAIERHPWAGHDLTWDDGEWCVRKIVDWTGQERV